MGMQPCGHQTEELQLNLQGPLDDELELDDKVELDAACCLVFLAARAREPLFAISISPDEIR
jgi:hypothetical protein